MKREIKFRAWNKEDKIMVDLQKITPLALNDMMNTQLNLQGRSGLFIPFFKELELMQYTGLKDRNGKEIYEGDIIRILYTDWNSQCLGTEKQKKMTLNDYLKSISHIGVCVFRDGGFGIEFWKDHVNSIFEGKHGRKEIIGNIHEHNFLLDSNF